MTPLLRDLASGDGGWIVETHARRYADRYGFDARFEALVARIVADFLDARDRPDRVGWIAADGDRRLGSVLCTPGVDARAARLRCLFVMPQAQGSGLGRRLVTACLDAGRDRNATRLELFTHKNHRAARRLYAAMGFVLTEAHPVHSFGQDLVEERWERRL